MNSKERKRRKAFLDTFTRPQLIAVAVQKEVLTFAEARSLTKEALIERLYSVNGLVSPVPA